MLTNAVTKIVNVITYFNYGRTFVQSNFIVIKVF